MNYKSFTIRNYRAIVGPLEIAVGTSSLMPIIGVNESGKTTVLQAIFAFDYYNDQLNDKGRHLRDTVNLYSTSSTTATISANIAVSKQELRDACLTVADDFKELASEARSYSRKKLLPEVLTITRAISTLKYSVGPYYFGTPAFQDSLAREIITGLPYILYFDDFRDKVQEEVEIPNPAPENPPEWLAILEQLFKKTDKSFSLYKLSAMDDRQRKTVLAQVQRKLNETITKEWQTFKLDDGEVLRISVGFRSETAQAPITNPSQPAGPTEPNIVSVPLTKNFITLDVIERLSGDDKYFHISDRSKGFYWFFNFVMKLEFNAKLVYGHDHAIYLLDEPGSYLHAFAQRKLCQKLRSLSESNWVAYCTHSHYLLDPEVIPIICIKVAEKGSDGQIGLINLLDYRSPATQKRSAIQPLLDALQIRPFILDLQGFKTTVITEGIYDYFALEMFKGTRAISVLPSVGAESIRYFVSLMIAWHIAFRALWDNDTEGKEQFSRAAKLFGEEITGRCLRLLPSKDEKKKILQDLFHGQDLVNVRKELGLPENCSFEHTVHSLYYSSKRPELLSNFSHTTLQNFNELFVALSVD